MSFTKVSGDFLENNISVGIVTAASVLNVGITTFHSTTAFVHDVNSTGVVTATAFYGDGSGLTGVASTDNIITGTAATFTGGASINDLSVTGNVTVGTGVTIKPAGTIQANSYIQSNSSFFTQSYFVAGAGGNGNAGFRADDTGFVEIRGDRTDAFRLRGTSSGEQISMNASNGSVTIASSIFHMGDTNTFFGFPAADTFTVETAGSERLRVDSAGKVGIGTDNPSNTLSVIGSDTPPVYIGGANPGIKFEDTNASGTPISYIYASDGQLSLRADDGNESGSSLIEFKVDGSERLRITDGGLNVTGVVTATSFSGDGSSLTGISAGYWQSTGAGINTTSNVGVGEASPSTRLHVTGANTSARGQLSIEGTSADARMSFYRDNDFIGHISGNSDHLDISTESGHHIEFSAAGTERLRINTDGGLQVGGTTATALARLHVNDNHGHEMTSGVNRSDSMMQWTSDGSAYLGGYFNSTRGYTAGNQTEHSIGVYGTAVAKHQGGATGVYGYGAGNVGEGGGVGVYGESYSAYVGMPSCGVKGYRRRGPSNGWGFGVWGQAETSLYSTNWAGCFEILSKTGSDTNNRGILVVGRDTNRTHYAMQIGSGTGSDYGTEVGSIKFTSSATTFNTSSDYRLKENIVDLTGAIDRVKTIPVHRFNFKVDPGNTVDGFIAHEVSPIVPEAVTGTKDEVENVYDKDGNVESTKPVYQAIDQSKLVPLLTAALQEAIAEIETLKTKVAALESS